MSGRGAEELASLEGNVDLLRISQASAVANARAELLATERLLDRVVLLGEWHVAFPRATSQLLRVIASDRDASAELASTVLASPWLDDDDADDILVIAFPTLSGALRDAAADRADVRRRVGLAEGVGYESVPPPDRAWLWPKGKPFPPADTVSGVQARLNYLDLGAGPITGDWTDLTRRAFTRWQVLNGLEPSGELDFDSGEDLALATPDAPDR